MLEPSNNNELPAIPGKRYFTIGEVSELCAVKPHVLRYWEQEFPQLKPVKRRGNRRYYQRDDVLTIRQIRSLLYDHGFGMSSISHAGGNYFQNEKELVDYYGALDSGKLPLFRGYVMTDEDSGTLGSDIKAVIQETIEELEDLLKTLSPAK